MREYYDTRLADLWQKAVRLAREHGLNKTATALGLEYESLRQCTRDGNGNDDAGK